MTIRDPHTKYGVVSETPYTREDYAFRRPDPSAHSAAEFSTSPSIPSGAALQALATADPAQYAGVMSAIAGELRAAADSTEGPQSGFLDALANQFETAATSMPAASPTDAATPNSASQPYLPQSPPTVPALDSEGLVERILDAVSLALSQFSTNSLAATDTTGSTSNSGTAVAMNS